MKSPENAPDYPKDFLDWSRSRLAEIADYADNELVYSSCKLSSVFRSEVQNAPNGIEAQELLAAAQKRQIEIYNEGKAAGSEYSKINTDIGNPYQSKLMAFSGHVNELASNKLDRNSESGKKLKDSYKHTHTKDFFKVMSESINSNKWNTAKAVGAQAVLKAVWRSIFS